MMWLVLSALCEHAPDVFDDITWRLFWNSSEERLTCDLPSSAAADWMATLWQRWCSRLKDDSAMSI